jgi:hypothetical protein
MKEKKGEIQSTRTSRERQRRSPLAASVNAWKPSEKKEGGRGGASASRGGSITAEERGFRVFLKSSPPLRHINFSALRTDKTAKIAKTLTAG